MARLLKGYSFEANVLQIDKKKKELPDNRGWHLQSYILLENDIEIEISNDKYELLNIEYR